MASKVNLLPTVQAHVATLNDARTGRARLADFALFYGVPVVAGLASGFSGFRMNDIGGFLGGLAVFTALLFGLVIFLFQLRMQIKEANYETLRPRFTRFIDQVFANVNYAVAVGVITTALGVLGTSIGDERGAPVWLSAVLVTFCVHLLLTILMCIKRVTSAYEQLT